jgi:hypothetical protein
MEPEGRPMERLPEARQFEKARRWKSWRNNERGGGAPKGVVIRDARTRAERSCL